MNIIENIKNGSITPIGWGCGQMFRYRKYIHDFDVAFTIDTRNAIDEIDGVKIKCPSVLEEINQEKHVLIIYTIDFLDYVYEYCEKFPNLICLPFNCNELGVKEKISNLKSAHDTFFHHGISYLNIRRI